MINFLEFEFQKDYDSFACNYLTEGERSDEKRNQEIDEVIVAVSGKEGQVRTRQEGQVVEVDLSGRPPRRLLSRYFPKAEYRI